MVDDSTKNTGGEVAAQGGSIEGEGLVNLTNDVEPDNGGQQQAAAVNQQSENILSNNNLDTPAPATTPAPPQQNAQLTQPAPNVGQNRGPSAQYQEPSNGPVGNADKVEGERSNTAQSAPPNNPIQNPQQTKLGDDVLELQTIKNIQVNVQAVLGGVSMSISKLSNLKEGELVSLEKNIGDEIEILANGQLIAHGEIVVIEGDAPKFGITLTNIVGSGIHK